MFVLLVWEKLEDIFDDLELRTFGMKDDGGGERDVSRDVGEDDGGRPVDGVD